jgi:hypothetical protein
MRSRLPLAFVVALAATVVAASYIIYRLVDPLPPRSLAIAAGAAGSGYDNFARQYARILARHGVELEIRNFAGAVENLDRLRDPTSGMQAALATFGVTQPADADIFYSLGGNIRCRDIHFLPERGACYAFFAAPWQAHFHRPAGNRPAIAYAGPYSFSGIKSRSGVSCSPTGKLSIQRSASPSTRCSRALCRLWLLSRWSGCTAISIDLVVPISAHRSRCGNRSNVLASSFMMIADNGAGNLL